MDIMDNLSLPSFLVANLVKSNLASGLSPSVALSMTIRRTNSNISDGNLHTTQHTTQTDMQCIAMHQSDEHPPHPSVCVKYIAYTHEQRSVSD